MGDKNKNIKKPSGLNSLIERANLMEKQQKEGLNILPKPDTNDVTGLGFNPQSEQANIPSEFKKIKDRLNINPNYQSYHQMLRDADFEQNTWEEFKTALGGFGVKAVQGIVDSIASYDVVGNFDLAVGNYEKDYGNWLNKIGHSIREYANENFQIHNSKPNTMWSTAYWNNMFSELGYTGGIITTSMVESAVLDTLTGGLRHLGMGAVWVNRLKMLGKGLHGAMKGVHEGYMNALETQQSLYKELIDFGYTHEEAERLANKGATRTFRAEVGPLALLNSIQFMTAFGNPKTAFRQSGAYMGVSDGIETLLSKVAPKLADKKGVGFAFQTLSEGIEEVYQTSVGQYATHKTLKEVGHAVGDYSPFNQENLDSFIAGMLGGALFSGGSNLVNKYILGNENNNYKKDHADFIDKAVISSSIIFKEQSDLFNKYKEALFVYQQSPTKENKTKIEQIIKDIKYNQINAHLNNTKLAIELDYINGNTNAFDSHIEQLESIQKAVENNDFDTLRKHGLIDSNNNELYEGSFDFIKNNFKSFIDISKKFQKKMDNTLLNITPDIQQASKIVQLELQNEELLSDIEQAEKDKSSLETNDIFYNKLSEEGKKRFNIEIELVILNNKNSLTEQDKQRKKELIEELKSFSNDYSSKDKPYYNNIDKIAHINANKKIDNLKSEFNKASELLIKSKDSKYLKEDLERRKELAMELAKTKKELEKARKEAESKGGLSKRLSELFKKKEKQLEANDKINELNPGHEKKYKPKKPGDIVIPEKKGEEIITPTSEEKREVQKPVTPEETSDIGNLFASGLLSSGGINGLPNNNIVNTLDDNGNQLFSPREFDPSKLNNEQLNKLKSYYERVLKYLDKKLGKIATFKDFVEYNIETFGESQADMQYEAYIFTWEKVLSKPKENYTEIYNELFFSPESISNIFNQGLTENEAKGYTEQVEKQVQKEKSKISSVPNGKNPIERSNNMNGYKTNVPTNKAGFLGVAYEEVKNEDGTFSKVTSVPQLHKSDFINNNLVLDHDYIKVGEELEVKIPENVDEIKITDWTWDSNNKIWQKTTITFGEWQKKHNVQKGSEAYNNKVPLVAYKDNQPIFYIHDTQWYNSNNVEGTKYKSIEEVIKEAIEENIKTRKEILSGNNKIKITDRTFGNLFRLNNQKNPQQPKILSEATSDTQLSIAVNFSDLQDSSSKANGNISDKINIINNREKNPLKPGQIYEIRKINTNEYIALPTITNDVSKGEIINDIAYNNTKYSVVSSVILNAPKNLKESIAQRFGLSLSKVQDIQKEILRTTNIDIEHDLGSYLGMFLYVEKMQSKLVLQLESNELNSEGTLKYPIGKNYFAFDNNVLTVVNKTGNPLERNKNGYAITNGIPLKNISEKNINIIYSFIDNLFKGDNGQFRQSTFAISKEQLGKNNEFIEITSEGNIKKYDSNKNGENTYEGYIKDNLKTNVQSFNIKDFNGNVKSITDVQPNIYYEVIKESNSSNDNQTPESYSKPKIINNPNSSIGESKTFKNKEKDKDEDKDVQIENKNKTFEQNIQKAIESLPDDLKNEISKFRFENFNVDSFNFNFSRRELSNEEIALIEGLSNNQISVLTPLQQRQLENSLFNIILKSISLKDKSININSLYNTIINSVNDNLLPQIEKLSEMRDKIEKLNDPQYKILIDNFNFQINRLESIIKEQNKLTSNGNSSPKGSLYERLERFFGEQIEEQVSEQDNILQDDNSPSEHNFSLTSFERDFKTSFSISMKLFFSGITKGDSNFSYLDNFESIDDVILGLMEIMVGIPSNLKSLLDVLELKKNDKYYGVLLDKIKNAPENIQNEILYKMITSKLNMEAIMIEQSKNSTTLKLFNPNSNSMDIKIKQQWKNNFYNSENVIMQNGNKVIVKEKIKEIIDSINELINKGNLNKDNLNDVKPIFKSLGIETSDEVIENILEKQGKNILSSTGILGVMKNNLNTAYYSNPNDSTLDFNTFEPYKNANKVVDNIIDIEIDLSGSRLSKSFRVAGKSIQGVIQKMMAYDVKEELKNPDSELFQALQILPYTSKNYVLQILQTNEKFREDFDISFVSLEAIKKRFSSSFGEKKIDKLVENDYILSQLGFFQNTLRDLGQVLPDSKLSFRSGYMFNPTLSDKGQMILYSTALLNLDYKNFNINGTNVSANREVLEFLYTQLFEGEFNRIVQSYNNPVNIKGYKEASKRFINIPSFNDIHIDNVNIHDLIANSYYNPDTINIIKEKVKESVIKKIQSLLDSELFNKINYENSKGEFYEAGFLDEKHKLKFLDSKYLSEKKAGNNNLSDLQLAKISALDFIINNLLNQSNTYQLIAGDSALYAPKLSKFINSEGNINNVSFSKAVGESITKRMAMLIAPGNKIANSYGESYYQIMVNDPVKISSISENLIQDYYGKISENNKKALNKLKEIEDSIQEKYNNRKTNEKYQEEIEKLEKEKSSIMSFLSKNNPDIKGYFEIEGTDAQEYTTWQEHLDIMFRQGNLTVQEVEKLKSAQEKLKKGEELNSKELKLIMQPIKPVYAGSTIERDNNGVPIMNRIVYIKSSSFPLLPQLTKGLKIDKIRQHMESLATLKGNENKVAGVRLSYQTANKIGAIDTNLNVNDLYNLSFEELYNEEGTGKLNKSYLKLDRNNFKIQQEVPYKTGKNIKNNENDFVLNGSQFWKLLMGNGINKITDEIFNNIFDKNLIDYIDSLNENIDSLVDLNKEKLTGKELDILKFKVEKRYIDLQKQILYEELGLDEKTGKPINNNKTLLALKDILQKEIATRNYPDNMLHVLELKPIELNPVDLEFNLPLWFNDNSNKFETLLQSIIASRIIDIYLPGNGHVSTSSEGFESITSLNTLDDKIKPNIVWLNPNHTGELKSTRYESENSVRNQLSVNKIEGETLIYGDVKLIEKSTGKDTKKITFESKIRSKKGTESTLSYKTFNNLKELEDLIGEIDYEDVDDIEVFNKSNNSGRIKLREIRISYDGIVAVNFINSEGLEQDWKIKNPKIKYNEDSKGLKESEVLIQSKFRVTKTDENGNKYAELIDLTKEPYSTRNKKGQLVINTGMIDESLLSMFSFRIPTSSHQSGAILKVIGFLPEASGDMLVVPKEHTQQIGEDYDIDKRYLYKSNYIVNKEGKIKKLIFDKDKILKSNKPLKEELKYLENAMIDIYKSLYTSSDVNVQKSINKILSFDTAKQTANMISDRINNFKNNINFTILSDTYQRQQMKLGADGKTGVGGHSIAVTFQSQMERLDEPIIIMDENNEPIKVIIGNLVSNGTIGRPQTLTDIEGKEFGDRNVGDIHTENQNSATDNIKAMIMGNRNENPYTMGVLIQLTFRGFDKGVFNNPNPNSKIDSLQVPSLIISQPIIREYVRLMNKYKSIINTKNLSNDKLEKKVMEELIETFNINNDINILRHEYTGEILNNFLNKEEFESFSKELTANRLYDELINQEDLKTWTPKSQLAVLQLFLNIKKESEELSEYIRMFNINTSKLGLSYLNTINKIETLNKFAKDSKFKNIRKLIGDFLPLKDEEGHVIMYKEKDLKGYTLIGDNYIKPTTSEGVMFINTIKSAKNILPLYFPYEKIEFQNILKNIVQVLNKDNLRDRELVNFEYEVLSEVKEFIFANKNTGLFNGDVNTERFRLFMDKDGNTSLGTYLYKLKLSGHPIFTNNYLLKELTFDMLNINGSPSIIKFNKTNTVNFDATGTYNSFLDLLQDNETDLGVWNGENITPRKLAQDLATYSYLSNKEGGAISFRDFISLQYLDIIGVTKNLRDIFNSREGFDFNTFYSNFEKQFVQHNPQYATDITNEFNNITKDEINLFFENYSENLFNSKNVKLLNNLKWFKLQPTITTSKYLRIKDDTLNLSKKDYRLYERIDDTNTYIEIGTLGSFGFNEYNPSLSNQNSIIYPNIGGEVVNTNFKHQDINISSSIEKILGKDNILNNIKTLLTKTNSPTYQNIINNILPFIDPTTKVKYEAIETPFGELKTALYDKSSNTIYINPNIIKNLNDTLKAGEDIGQVLEEVFLEEILHSITANQLDKYGTINNNGTFTPYDNAPVFIYKLANLHKLAKQNLNHYYTKDIYEFVAGVFVSNEFRELLDKINFKNKTLLDIFKDVLASMVRFLKGSTYSDISINSVYQLLNYEKNIKLQQLIDDKNTGNVNKDKQIDEFLNNLEKNRSMLLDTLPLRDMKYYDKHTSDLFIQNFLKGSSLIVTSPDRRLNSSAEFYYIKDIINHLQAMYNDKNIIYYVDIINLSEGVQEIKFKNPIKSITDIYNTIPTIEVKFSLDNSNLKNILSSLNDKNNIDSIIKELEDKGDIEVICK